MKKSSAQLAPVTLRPPELLQHAVSDGVRVGMQLFPVPGMGRELSKQGAWWHAGRRMWVLAIQDAQHCLTWLRHVYAGQYVDFEGAPVLLQAAFAAPQKDFFTQLLDAQVFPLAQRDGERRKGAYAVSFTYDVLCVRTMRALGGRFHKPAAAWQVWGGVQRILDALREQAGIREEFVFVHERPVVLEQLVGAVAQEGLTIQVPGAPPPEHDPDAVVDEENKQGAGFLSSLEQSSKALPVDEKRLQEASVQAGLRDYQVAGVRHLLGQSGACLGDDMGLGKSRQTVVAARMAAGDDGRVLILCPATLRINWEREIHMVYPDAVVGMVGEDRISTLYGCQWVIANYERLGGLVREPELKFKVMAVDEAHYLKEYKAGRTRNAFVMAARIPRRYVITGTPLLNREIELHTLLRLTGHELGQLPLKEFRRDYSGSAENRAVLADALKGWMLRRRKDVLSDLGKKSRQVRWVSPAEGLGGYKEIYKDMTLQTMPKITRLRQCLESLKTPFLIETAESLSEGDKLIVFCEYMATVQAMQQAFEAAGIGCVTLVGADSGKKRQKAIEAFQSDPSITVFIGTTSAAGVGITLTAANYVAFASLPWTPAVMRQAEDRAYRLGQKRDVTVIVPLVSGTIDDGVWRLLQSKQETEQDVVEAVRAQLPGQQAES